LGTLGQINGRVKVKKKQMKPSALLAAGYVAVIEFGTPIAHVEAA